MLLTDVLRVHNRFVKFSTTENLATDFNILMILEAATKEINYLKCIQRDRDLWRVYVRAHDSRRKLLTQGFDLSNCNLRAFDTNPYSARTKHPSKSALKVTVKVFLYRSTIPRF